MHSIRRKLLITLIGALLAAGFTTAAATFFSAQTEFNKFLDTHLKETAESLAQSVTHSFPLADPDHLTIIGDAQSYHIVVQVYDSANNTVWQREDFAALWQAIAEREIYVLSDEVYEHICFAEGGHASVLAHPQLRERAVAVSSFGKTFHMTGWKVGYCVAPAAISAELRKVHQYLTFSVNTPAQLAIADMLREAPEHYRELPAFYRERRDLFIEALRPSRLEILPCEGTYFLLADYSAISDLDDVSFCRSPSSAPIRSRTS